MQPSARFKTDLFDYIPLPVVRALAAPYLAGNTSQQAVRLAHNIYKRSGIASTIDILGEDARLDQDCRRSLDLYKSLIDQIVAAPLTVSRPQEKPTISFKPSMLAVNPWGDSEAYRRIENLIDYASRAGVNATIESEDHTWTDFQLESYFSLIRKGYKNVGTVLQSRLLRTARDLVRFGDKTRVRMVLGIYNEPSEYAHIDKRVMKTLLVDYSAELVKRGTYVEFATHDAQCVDAFVARGLVPAHATRDQFEFQFLLGVPRAALQKSLVSGAYFKKIKLEAGKADPVAGRTRHYLDDLARSGATVRLYLPFGSAGESGPYCLRRLKSNPDLITYGIKNLLHLE